VARALDVYTADLGIDDTLPRALQHPGNVWSLHGLHECLTRLGRAAEARLVAHQLRIAAAVADVPIYASCFCRLSAIEPVPAADEHAGRGDGSEQPDHGCCTHS
jgi:hypothetical protein